MTRAGSSGTVGRHQVAAGRAHLDPGEGPAEFLGGAGGAGDDRAEPVVAAMRAAPAGRQRAAPAAVRRGVLAGQPQRPVAVRPADQGDAPGLGAAAAAGDRGQVAAPRHLDEDRAAGLERGAGGAEREAGQPGRGRRLVPAELPVVGGGPHPGGGGAQRGPVGGQVPGPAGLDELGELGGAGEPADEGGGAGPVGAQREHLPGVRVRGARLGVQVVAVVPQHHQAQVLDRGEHGRAGARDDPRLAPAGPEPAAVPFGRAEIGRQRDVSRCSRRSRRRGGQAASAWSTRARSRASGTTITAPRPALAAVTAARAISSGQVGPGSAIQAARAGRPAATASRKAGPAGYLAHGPGSGRGGRPSAGPAWPADGGCRSAGGSSAARVSRRLGRLGRLGRFCGRVALRDREAEHVGQRPRVPVGDGAREPGDLRGEHLLGRDDPLQVAEPALVLAAVHPVEDVAVGELAGEPDPDPDAGPGQRRQPFRDQVVEGAVQMGERQVHGDPRDRPIRRGLESFRVF